MLKWFWVFDEYGKVVPNFTSFKSDRICFIIRRLQEITGCYKGLQGVIRGYRRLQEVTGGYKGLRGVIGGYKGLQEVTRGYRGLQEVTGDYRGLQEVTRGYSGLQGITGGYNGLQMVTGFYGYRNNYLTWKLFQNDRKCFCETFKCK